MKKIVTVLAAACSLSLVMLIAPGINSPGAGEEQTTAAAPASAGIDPNAIGPDAADPAASANPIVGSDEGADAPYEANTLLVNLPEGTSSEALDSVLAPNGLLAGASIDKQGEGYAKLSLPAGMTVDAALDLLDAAGAPVSAQPNYYYHPAEKSASASVALDAQAATASLVAGTPLGNALGIQAAAKVNDPYYSKQWALASVNAPEAWGLVDANVGTKSAVTVAVIDEGFIVNHQDLKAHVVDYYNVAAGSTTMGTDLADHGTHVAGIVSAVANNSKGVAGVGYNACGLMLLRVADSNDDITTSAIVDAYTYLMKRASTHNVRVVNISLGGPGPSPRTKAVTRSTDSALYDAIERARKAGIVTVAAACNDDIAVPFYAFPSDFKNVVSVINLKKSSNADKVTREEGSNYNRSTKKTEKNISAPGTNIYSTYETATTYSSDTGTSMASPLVAGIVGLMFTVNPALTPDDIAKTSGASGLLYETAKDLTASPASAGWDRYTGWGEVDAAAAVKAAGATATTTKTSVARLSISASNRTYTGAALKPAVKVKHGSKTLKKGTDYTVKYRDNKKAGKATFTVRGIGNYCGIAVGTFTIAKSKLKSFSLKATSAVYNGKAHKPAIKKVKASCGTVTSANYKVTYLRNGKKTTDFKSRGTITVKVTGKNNCKGTLTKKFKIKR